MDLPSVSLEAVIATQAIENVRLRVLVQSLAAELQALKAQANGHAAPTPGPPAEEAPRG